jgi:2-hydroxychromene-2-carboxylate isomerase
MQDPVWAEQAHVFPDWHSYSSELSKRAALADRHWLDSIGLADTAVTAAVAADQQSSSLAGSSTARQEAGVGVMSVFMGRAAFWLTRLASRGQDQL